MAGTVSSRVLSLRHIVQPMLCQGRNANTRQILPTMAFIKRMSNASSHEYLLVEKKGEKGCVGLVTLNRPKALNALCEPMMVEMASVLRDLDNDPTVAAMVITGGEKAFVAGGDIKFMVTQQFSDFLRPNFLVQWNGITQLRKPTIAAVNGFALGGGCELAMMCDIILAGEKAKFGQPEIVLGTIPGGGGTQRLTRAIGKTRAMQMCLTGEAITAQEAKEWGLVSSVYPPEKVVDEAIKLGEKIGTHSKAVVALCKEAVNSALELSQREGLRFENQTLCSFFSLNDRKEGMMAFIENGNQTSPTAKPHINLR